LSSKVKVTSLLSAPDQLACSIASLWDQWDGARATWKSKVEEVRRYLFSTDTSTTSNSSLPWKNRTTIPKLCQIRDNLHAHYMASLFPNDNWFTWEAKNEDSASKAKRDIIRAYMRNKTRNNDFKDTISDLVLDYIDCGIAIADTEYVRETYEDAEGVIQNSYVGPKVIRISPLDIVFDPTAPNFDESPKIVRKFYNMGELEYIARNIPEKAYYQEAINKMKNDREELRKYQTKEVVDDYNLQIAGVGTYTEYLRSGTVEILEFEGNYHDPVSGEYYQNQKIVVADRRYILHQAPMDTIHGKSTKVMVGWRKRPGNLYAMGPLENLVGLQYRIDHLENLKADAFDLIAFPVFKIVGDVNDFNYGPMEKIYCGEEGDVQMMHPDVTALNADMQIAVLEQKMEEMAGAPKQAMGFRTPGEKTAFEVQVLENGASRIFQSKVNQFEEQFLERILNNMLERARTHMDVDTIRDVDEFGAEVFRSITAHDLRADGTLHPVGARHFTQKAQAIQNLIQFLNSAAGQDPTVTAHISGLKIAEAMEELLELKPYGLVKNGVRLEEQAMLTALSQQLNAALQRQSMRPDPVEQEIADASEMA